MTDTNLAYSDELLRATLARVRIIAMVGASPNWNRPSYFAMKYLQEKGYRVIPVNPRAAGEEILGETCYASLAEVPGRIDMVDIFRGSKEAGGIVDEALAGHVIFTTCGIDGGTEKVALLGPLAVAPALQRRGVGTAIVRAGLQAMEKAGASGGYVLGDPAYYGRFGFKPEDGVAPPYPLPDEWRGAWQSLSLSGSAPLQGNLTVPQPWRHKALWSP